jgi:hypothetical protein
MHVKKKRKDTVNDGKNQECDKYQKPKKSGERERESERDCVILAPKD